MRAGPIGNNYHVNDLLAIEGNTSLLMARNKGAFSRQLS